MDTKGNKHTENLGIFIGFERNRERKKDLRAELTLWWWVVLTPPLF